MAWLATQLIGTLDWKIVIRDNAALQHCTACGVNEVLFI